MYMSKIFILMRRYALLLPDLYCKINLSIYLITMFVCVRYAPERVLHSVSSSPVFQPPHGNIPALHMLLLHRGGVGGGV